MSQPEHNGDNNNNKQNRINFNVTNSFIIISWFCKFPQRAFSAADLARKSGFSTNESTYFII